MRSALLLAILFSLLAGGAVAQNKKPNPDEGYIPIVAPEDKRKKKGDDITQALPASPELPSAVTAEIDRLTYQVSPLSSKGLLSQQTREALKVLLKSNRGPIVKLRAFVAGSGDLRRIGEIAGEMFQDKHQPLPALSVAQVGALPLEGAQVVIEATEADRRPVNPYGVAFLSGQASPSVAQSLDKLKNALAGAGMQPSDALAVTCFISSLDDQRDTQEAMAASFPSAALDYVQMQRSPVLPAADCEAVARLRTASAGPVTFLNNSQMALISSPQVVISGTQLAFGTGDSDFKLALDRLAKTLAASKTSLSHIATAHYYVTSSGFNKRVQSLELAQAANTLLPIESLPSVDAVFGIDVIAVP